MDGIKDNDYLMIVFTTMVKRAIGNTKVEFCVILLVVLEQLC